MLAHADTHPTAEDKNNQLMSSSGLEATEEEMQEVLQDAGEDLMPADDDVAVIG